MDPCRVLRTGTCIALATVGVSAMSTPAPAASTPMIQAATDSVPAAESAPAPDTLFIGTPGITFKPGLRMQVRYEHDDADGNNDFFVRRVRVKAGGDVFGLAKYYAEVKIDNVGRFENVPNAQIENAWLDFPLLPDLNLRAGLYDFVFSRDALTSDSKLLIMDRSLVKGALTVLGLADNTVGLLAHGRPLGGRLEYSGGVFDNIAFEGVGVEEVKRADGAMLTGRVGIHLLDPAPRGGYADYRGSYVGEGRRLVISTNAAYLSKARIDERELDLFAWGVDLFFNWERITLQGEYDLYEQNPVEGVDPDITGDGWYAQGGYLFHPLFEVAARYQELDTDNAVVDKLRWTSIGFNSYIRGHNLKIQADYTFKREEAAEVDNDVFQVQLQLDY